MIMYPVMGAVAKRSFYFLFLVGGYNVMLASSTQFPVLTLVSSLVLSFCIYYWYYLCLLYLLCSVLHHDPDLFQYILVCS